MPEYNAEEWIQKLGNYELGTQVNPISTEQVNANVETVLGEGAYAKLQAGTNNAEVKLKREGLLKQLAYGLNNHPANNHEPSRIGENKGKAIKLEDLLKELQIKGGVKTFKAALKEEQKSPQFRDAVFAKSIQYYGSQKWPKKLALWVGGPSASGKTFASNAMVNEVSNNLFGSPPSDTNQGVNPVVSIDGGNEREISQMRQMILQAALSLGYSGISDLHSNTNDLKTKHLVLEAAEYNGELSLVIPATFAADIVQLKTGGLAKLNPSEEKYVYRFKKYANDETIQQVFSQVTHSKYNEKAVENAVVKASVKNFKKAVGIMGTGRAFDLDGSKGEALRAVNDNGQVDNFKMNNREIGVESKEYEKKYFKSGVEATQSAKGAYEKAEINAGKQPIVLQSINDIVYIKQNDGVISECESSNDEGIMLTSRRALAEWINNEDLRKQNNNDYSKWRDKTSSSNYALYKDKTSPVIEGNPAYKAAIASKQQQEQAKKIERFQSPNITLTREPSTPEISNPGNSPLTFQAQRQRAGALNPPRVNLGERHSGEKRPRSLSPQNPPKPDQQKINEGRPLTTRPRR